MPEMTNGNNDQVSFYGRAPQEGRAVERFRGLMMAAGMALSAVATVSPSAQAQTVDMGMILHRGMSGDASVQFAPSSPSEVSARRAILEDVGAGKVTFNPANSSTDAPRYVAVVVPLAAGTPVNQGVVGNLHGICAYPERGGQSACLVMNIRFDPATGASLPDIKNPEVGAIPRGVERQITTDAVLLGQITLGDPRVSQLAQKVAANFTRANAEELRVRMIASIGSLVGAHPDPSHAINQWSGLSHVLPLVQPVTFR